MATHHALLPRDLLELQLGQIDLLLAMYQQQQQHPSTNSNSNSNSDSDEAESIAVEESSWGLLTALRRWCEHDDGDIDDDEESSDVRLRGMVSRGRGLGGVTLRLRLGLGGGGVLELDVVVPLSYERQVRDDAEGDDEDAPLEPPNARVRIRQAAWMSKAVLSQLTHSIPTSASDPGGGADDLFGIIDDIKTAATTALTSPPPTSTSATTTITTLSTTTSTSTSTISITSPTHPPLVRAWFYFPTISTRSKRTDMTTHAPHYSLTGFLYAGKPGLLCVEGTPANIDAYMRWIKTESWSDVPGYQKKVSERWREVLCGSGGGVEGDGDGDGGKSGSGAKGGGRGRVFQDMQEITDELGERHGKKVNRGDMKALEAWLVEKGLGEAFGRVLI